MFCTGCKSGIMGESMVHNNLLGPASVHGVSSIVRLRFFLSGFRGCRWQCIRI